MKIILSFIICCISFFTTAQMDPALLIGINTATTVEIAAIPKTNVSEGSLIYNSDLKSLLHFNNSEWVIVSDEGNRTKISNELIFDDTTYYYVSMTRNTTKWIVIRYDKSNINAETMASGEGSQPLTLAECIPLTYL